jgi:hypothetical protein
MEKKIIHGKEVFICYADDMHPYNCDGMFGGRCIHCETVKTEDHSPEKCALCNFFDE